MTSIDLDKLSSIAVLDRGGHENPAEGLCLMEAVAYVSGLEHTDRPPCVSSVLGNYGRTLNDLLPDDLRQELKRYIPLLPGTADDGLDETQRRYLAIDWMVRTCVPMWLDLAGLSDEAQDLRELPRVIDSTTCPQPGDLGTVIAQARNAWDTSRGKFWTAPRVYRTLERRLWNPADLLFKIVELPSAESAILYAASAAVWNELKEEEHVGDIPYSRILDILGPTVTQSQQSAIDLFGRMIKVTYGS